MEDGRCPSGGDIGSAGPVGPLVAGAAKFAFGDKGAVHPGAGPDVVSMAKISMHIL